MPQQIRNEQDLRKIMQKAVNDVILVVSEKLLVKLKEQIKQDVYTEPNTWYERTGEFENAFVWGSIRKGINSITREMSYDSSRVKHDGKWVHGNPGRSSAENLADILNLAFNSYEPGYTSSLKFGDRYFSHYRRPYWENYIELLFDKNGLEKMFTEEFSKYGIVKI